MTLPSLLDVVVARRDEQAIGIVVLDLVAVDGRALPGFTAGAHIDVHLGPGLVRPYSLCGDPADTTRYRIGVLREPGSRGGSAAVHDRLLDGCTVRIGAPRNTFPLSAAPHSVLIAGGIGVTPLIAMAYHLYATGQDFTLHYCARSRDRAAFLDELAETPFSSDVNLHFDNGPASERLILPEALPPAIAGAHVYVCGPLGFADWAMGAARAAGYTEGQLHREDFVAAPVAMGDAFEVVLAHSGRAIQVPSGVTIVAALAAAGVMIDVSCEQGICGTCLCTVLDGVPEHHDVYLTDEEKADNDQALLCCARARTPQLVLDL